MNAEVDVTMVPKRVETLVEGRSRRIKRERDSQQAYDWDDSGGDEDVEAAELLQALSPRKPSTKKNGVAKKSTKASKSAPAAAAPAPSRKKESGDGQPYSRKSKSLGLLATRFVVMCQNLPVTPKTVSLDNASKTLVVVRRRIYDVVNVLQAIGIVMRRGKNSYDWIGAPGLRTTLQELGSVGHYDWDTDNHKQKRGESLGVLSRKFVVLFLSSEPGTVLSLESAALAMKAEDESGDGGDDDEDGEKGSNAAKTKVRRLYDVANIFAALGIILKKRLQGARKPGFMWNGQNPVISGEADFGPLSGDDDDDQEDELVAGGAEQEDEDYNEANFNNNNSNIHVKAAGKVDAENKANLSMVLRKKKKNSGRKIFGGDEEATQTVGEMLPGTPFTPASERGVEDVLALAQNHAVPFKKQKNISALLNDDAALDLVPDASGMIMQPVAAVQEGSQQQLVVVKGDYAFPVNSRAFASPETEKNIASLLMNFSQSSPAPNQTAMLSVANGE